MDQLPADEVLAEIDAKVDTAQLEGVLMAQGVKKFAEPQKASERKEELEKAKR